MINKKQQVQMSDCKLTDKQVNQIQKRLRKQGYFLSLIDYIEVQKCIFSLLVERVIKNYNYVDSEQLIKFIQQISFKSIKRNKKENAVKQELSEKQREDRELTKCIFSESLSMLGLAKSKVNNTYLSNELDTIDSMRNEFENLSYSFQDFKEIYEIITANRTKRNGIDFSKLGITNDKLIKLIKYVDYKYKSLSKKQFEQTYFNCNKFSDEYHKVRKESSKHTDF